MQHIRYISEILV